MEAVNSILSSLSDLLFGTVLVWVLLGAGIWFTLGTRAVQLRHMGSIARAVAGSRGGAEGGISSFQAFAVGLACRVGTGNIVGVALALVLGGPGAVLWMWLVALLGTATAFTEAVAVPSRARWAAVTEPTAAGRPTTSPVVCACRWSGAFSRFCSWSPTAWPCRWCRPTR